MSVNVARLLGALGFLAFDVLVVYAAGEGTEVYGEPSGFATLWALVWFASRLAIGMWIGEALWHRGRRR